MAQYYVKMNVNVINLNVYFLTVQDVHDIVKVRKAGYKMIA